jgi:hypothetical protein
MTTVQSIHRTSTVAVTSTDTTDSSAPAPSDDTSLMPPPGLFGGEDAMTALAALLVKADNKDRDTSRLIEDAADKSALDDAYSHADALSDKANKEATEAYVSGAFQIAGGLATSISAGRADGSAWRVGWNGAGQALPGLGTILSAGFKADATRDDAQGVTLDAQAQCAIRRFNAAHDDSQAATESIQKVEQFLQSVVQSENETRNVAASMLRG